MNIDIVCIALFNQSAAGRRGRCDCHSSRGKLLADFRAIASRIVLLNQAGSLRGAWKQVTRRRLLHGAKADGEADEPPSTNPPLPGWVWVHIKGGGVGVGGWGKEKPQDEACRGEAREALWIMLTIA